MVQCFFASDLHGAPGRYEKLFHVIEKKNPAAVFLGGDLLPHFFLRAATQKNINDDFVNDFLGAEFKRLKRIMKEDYPGVFLILGNDDSRSEESAFEELEKEGIWNYIHERSRPLSFYRVYGYSYIPPSPFHNKDWERYDVSRHVDPGCVSPEEGRRSVTVPRNVMKHSTIQQDLEKLAGKTDLHDALFLFHSPPYETKLDRAGLDGKFVDGVPLDVHVGSIAVRKFIESRQPLLTLHGHIHESTRLSGSWRDRIGRTHMFGAAHDGEELALVEFDLDDLDHAKRELL
jgi:Icc-related predicted phosphoesterase